MLHRTELYTKRVTLIQYENLQNCIFKNNVYKFTQIVKSLSEYVIKI